MTYETKVPYFDMEDNNSLKLLFTNRITSSLRIFHNSARQITVWEISDFLL